MLKESSPLLRAKAVEGLGMAGARELAPLIAPLAQDSALQVRQLAALALFSFQHPSAADALKALTENPETAGLVQPQLMLGLMAMQNKDYAAARTYFERATETMPYYTDALIMLADANGFDDRLNEAEKVLRQAALFDPENPKVRERLGMDNP
jgi:Tfp pilus assembly protein PilF